MIGTGGAVRDRGGWEIQEEASAYIEKIRHERNHAYLNPGEVAITKAGKLPFKAIIHCIAIDAFHGSSNEVIRVCTRNALTTAATMPNVCSIAIPVLASGNGQYDFQTSVRLMLEEIRDHAPGPLEEVLIVVYEDWRVSITNQELQKALHAS